MMKKMNLLLAIVVLTLLLFSCSKKNQAGAWLHPTSDDGTRLILKKTDLSAGVYHTRHFKIFCKYVNGYNLFILQGVDRVQSTAPDGGGYFIGKDSVPTESPIGYTLKLLGRPLLSPPRTTSYCSGSSYGAFIEGLDLLFKAEKNHPKLDSLHYEALRMQEVNGGRREDHVKFWGEWNADGFGDHFALVQYSGMGEAIEPIRARPGDFMNISWKSGVGHSVVFLGWYIDEQGTKNVVYWSSQRGTNGYGDAVVPIDRIKEVMVVRLTHPERLFTFNVQSKKIDTSVKGFQINW